jgi:hypothetical protein
MHTDWDDSMIEYFFELVLTIRCRKCVNYGRRKLQISQVRAAASRYAH